MAMPRTSIEPPPSAFRRRLILGAVALPAVPLAWAQTKAPNLPTPLIEVWKGPACGCCKAWITHLQANGIRGKVHDVGNTDARERLGVKLEYASCHTGLIGGYAIEGHVPAREILRLLKERPAAVGLAVPAMPLGSPGMDGPDYDNQKQAYDVLLLTKDGNARVFATYR